VAKKIVDSSQARFKLMNNYCYQPNSAVRKETDFWKLNYKVY